MAKVEIKWCIYGCGEYFKSMQALENHAVEVHGAKRGQSKLSAQERAERDKKSASLWATGREELF